ncbi:MAG: Gfo/Idh/MocA family oxidoreductase [Spirochaetales bacterium]|nr:Gfo/Idh/MocA family oxidoreductase [Spirochaetales bacterium]
MKKLRWGVLGLSGHYQKRIHLPLSKFEGAELYGLASRSLEKAEAAAERLGFRRAFGSYTELIECRDIDAVYIPLPNTMHLEWIKKAADAGKHIICEKPLGLTEEETEEAFSYCESKGVYLMEAFMFRFHPQWLRVMEIVNSNEIGQIKAIQCVFSYDNTDPDNIRNKKEGGGALRDIGCYGIAVSSLIMERDPDGVQGLIDIDPNFETDRLTSFILDYSDCHSLVTVSTQMQSAQNVKIIGSSGSIEVLVPFNTYIDVPARVRVLSGVGERIIKTEIADQYHAEFKAFSEAVLNNDSGFLKKMEAFSKRNQRVIDAVFKAGR